MRDRSSLAPDWLLRHCAVRVCLIKCSRRYRLFVSPLRPPRNIHSHGQPAVSSDDQNSSIHWHRRNRSYQGTLVTTPRLIYSIILRQMNDVPFPTSAGNEILIRVQYAGVNYIDTYFRTGTYPLQAIPWTAGQEAAGILERLPTDPAVLNDPDFKARNYQVGQTVAFVSAGQP